MLKQSSPRPPVAPAAKKTASAPAAAVAQQKGTAPEPLSLSEYVPLPVVKPTRHKTPSPLSAIGGARFPTPTSSPATLPDGDRAPPKGHHSNGTPLLASATAARPATTTLASPNTTDANGGGADHSRDFTGEVQSRRCVSSLEVKASMKHVDSGGSASPFANARRSDSQPVISVSAFRRGNSDRSSMPQREPSAVAGPLPKLVPQRVTPHHVKLTGSSPSQNVGPSASPKNRLSGGADGGGALARYGSLHSSGSGTNNISSRHTAENAVSRDSVDSTHSGGGGGLPRVLDTVLTSPGPTWVLPLSAEEVSYGGEGQRRGAHPNRRRKSSGDGGGGSDSRRESYTDESEQKTDKPQRSSLRTSAEKGNGAHATVTMVIPSPPSLSLEGSPLLGASHRREKDVDTAQPSISSAEVGPTLNKQLVAASRRSSFGRRASLRERKEGGTSLRLNDASLHDPSLGAEDAGPPSRPLSRHASNLSQRQQEALQRTSSFLSRQHTPPPALLLEETRAVRRRRRAPNVAASDGVEADAKEGDNDESDASSSTLHTDVRSSSRCLKRRANSRDGSRPADGAPVDSASVSRRSESYNGKNRPLSPSLSLPPSSPATLLGSRKTDVDALSLSDLSAAAATRVPPESPPPPPMPPPPPPQRGSPAMAPSEESRRAAAFGWAGGAAPTAEAPGEEGGVAGVAEFVPASFPFAELQLDSKEVAASSAGRRFSIGRAGKAGDTAPPPPPPPSQQTTGASERGAPARGARARAAMRSRRQEDPASANTTHGATEPSESSSNSNRGLPLRPRPTEETPPTSVALRSLKESGGAVAGQQRRDHGAEQRPQIGAAAAPSTAPRPSPGTPKGPATATEAEAPPRQQPFAEGDKPSKEDSAPSHSQQVGLPTAIQLANSSWNNSWNSSGKANHLYGTAESPDRANGSLNYSLSADNASTDSNASKSYLEYASRKLQDRRLNNSLTTSPSPVSASVSPSAATTTAAMGKEEPNGAARSSPLSPRPPTTLPHPHGNGSSSFLRKLDGEMSGVGGSGSAHRQKKRLVQAYFDEDGEDDIFAGAATATETSSPLNTAVAEANDRYSNKDNGTTNGNGFHSPLSAAAAHPRSIKQDFVLPARAVTTVDHLSKESLSGGGGGVPAMEDEEDTDRGLLEGFRPPGFNRRHGRRVRSSITFFISAMEDSFSSGDVTVEPSKTTDGEDTREAVAGPHPCITFAPYRPPKNSALLPPPPNGALQESFSGSPPSFAGAVRLSRDSGPVMLANMNGASVSSFDMGFYDDMLTLDGSSKTSKVSPLIEAERNPHALPIPMCDAPGPGPPFRDSVESSCVYSMVHLSVSNPALNIHQSPPKLDSLKAAAAAVAPSVSLLPPPVVRPILVSKGNLTASAKASATASLLQSKYAPNPEKIYKPIPNTFGLRGHRKREAMLAARSGEICYDDFDESDEENDFEEGGDEEDYEWYWEEVEEEDEEEDEEGDEEGEGATPNTATVVTVAQR